MKVHAASLGFLALFATLGLVAAQTPPAREPQPAKPGEQAAESQEREPDVRAITDLLASFVKAYNAKDAKALGPLFTPEAEIEDDGEVTKGRDAIVERFLGMFKEDGGDSLSVNSDSLRFLGTDIAIEQGTASLTTRAGEPPQTNRYSVIYARQGGRWLHASILDEQPDEDSPHEQLEQLAWMLGEWVNEGDEGIVNTTCTWSDDGNFLQRVFEVKVEGRIALSGTQRIGWDAQRKQFRVWVFDDRGGFADGLVSRDGERWIIKTSGVRSDGRSVSVTTAFTALGKDKILWETLERSVSGEVVSGTDQFYLVRPAPTPGK
ncbi:MAG: SgcJ/EcaC family oxidoreductase [Paludisphaera borealis]|uniref:YybH family protein n=1 Tax=Paludisphaera borealis TaxID=1387353 RepID=UPI00284FD824|nr:SgcJ/EcaC family oxidoreductase [Paludisphaera borealis]MDR3622330.1 SgcJ/EcaC family oxidoreductase [Paludisphaera borealis]